MLGCEHGLADTIAGRFVGIASLIIHTIGAYCYDAYQWDASPDVDHHQERLWSVEGSQLVYWIQHARLRERP